MAWGTGTTKADAQEYGAMLEASSEGAEVDNRSFYLDDSPSIESAAHSSPTFSGYGAWSELLPGSENPLIDNLQEEASQALRATTQALSPSTTGNILDDLTFYPFRDRLPQSALDQVWKTSEGLEMMPISHGTTESIRPDLGWSPEHAVHKKSPSASPVRNRGWYAHATHDPEVLRTFSSGGLYGQHHGDVPLSEYKKGFQLAPTFREAEIRLAADDFNKAFQMGDYVNDPLARLDAKTIHTPNRLGRLVPFAGAALAGADAAIRFSNLDFVGAGLGIMSGVPGPIGWGGLGMQVAYDLIRSGIKKGTLKTQEDIDAVLGIFGPPGIRGDY